MRNMRKVDLFIKQGNEKRCLLTDFAIHSAFWLQFHPFECRPQKIHWLRGERALSDCSFWYKSMTFTTEDGKLILHLIESSVLELCGSPADSCHGKLGFS